MSVAPSPVLHARQPSLGTPGLGALFALILGTLLLGYYYGPAQGALFSLAALSASLFITRPSASPPRGGYSSWTGVGVACACR